MRTNKELAYELLKLAEENRKSIEDMKLASENLNDIMLRACDTSIAVTQLCFKMLKKLEGKK